MYGNTSQDILQRAHDLYTLRERISPDSSANEALLRLAEMVRHYIQLLDSADDTGFAEGLGELDAELRLILGVDQAS